MNIKTRPSFEKFERYSAPGTNILCIWFHYYSLTELGWANSHKILGFEPDFKEVM